jgi:hypothetical protein
MTKALTALLVVEPDILVRMIISYLRECGYKILEGVSAADVMAVLDSGNKVDRLFGGSAERPAGRRRTCPLGPRTSQGG